MYKVHFIALGGTVMHNLAIALKIKKNYQISGSDDKIPEPIHSRLLEHGLLPEELGWFPEKLSKSLSAVIAGMDVKPDNPELLKAKELGLKIYSIPEYIFQQTRNKTRIVVCGSRGATNTTAMILHVLKSLKIDFDYMVNPDILGFENMIKLTYDSRIAVLEGDENLTSDIYQKPKFHFYKPHIAVITGIDKEQMNEFSSFEEFVEQFRIFIDQMEFQGRLIYFAGDDTLNQLAGEARRDLIAFPYNLDTFEIVGNQTFIKTIKTKYPLSISGENNLQNLNAAKLACKQIGVSEHQFLTAMQSFSEAQIKH